MMNEDDNVGWPRTDNVLAALSEDVRPLSIESTGAVEERRRTEEIRAAAVRQNVRLCLDDLAVPAESVPAGPSTVSTASGRVAASKRIQVAVMSIRSAYVDGNYYCSSEPYVFRTVEEILSWDHDRRVATIPPSGENTYTAGRVSYPTEASAADGQCFLRGFVDAQLDGIPVECSRLAVLPRHRSTIKLYAKLTINNSGQPIFMPHHFHVFSGFF